MVLSNLQVILSFAKTPPEAILIHVTCYTPALYVIDFTCALDFGEAKERFSPSQSTRSDAMGSSHPSLEPVDSATPYSASLS